MKRFMRHHRRPLRDSRRRFFRDNNSRYDFPDYGPGTLSNEEEILRTRERHARGIDPLDTPYWRDRLGIPSDQDFNPSHDFGRDGRHPSEYYEGADTTHYYDSRRVRDTHMFHVNLPKYNEEPLGITLSEPLDGPREYVVEYREYDEEYDQWEHGEIYFPTSYEASAWVRRRFRDKEAFEDFIMSTGLYAKLPPNNRRVRDTHGYGVGERIVEGALTQQELQKITSMLADTLSSPESGYGYTTIRGVVIACQSQHEDDSIMVVADPDVEFVESEEYTEYDMYSGTLLWSDSEISDDYWDEALNEIVHEVESYLIRIGNY